MDCDGFGAGGLDCGHRGRIVKSPVIFHVEHGRILMNPSIAAFFVAQIGIAIWWIVQFIKL